MFSKIQNKELDLLAAYNRKEGPSKFMILLILVMMTLPKEQVKYFVSELKGNLLVVI